MTVMTIISFILKVSILIMIILSLMSFFINKKAKKRYKETEWINYVNKRIDGNFRETIKIKDKKTKKITLKKVPISYKKAKSMKVIPKYILKSQMGIYSYGDNEYFLCDTKRFGKDEGIDCEYKNSKKIKK